MTQSIIEIEALNATIREWRDAGQKIAFVPTMGALHPGHLSLIETAKSNADRVIASIFVNPTQFGPNEDFARYPRTLSDDMQKLSASGTDAVFLPNTQAIYPEGFSTYVVPTTGVDILCGASRPGHFRGVLTVVLKLMNMVRPDVSVFGKKDYQQLMLIRKMVHDLNVPVEVIGAEIVRESDGLAMSSRNRYLGDSEREMAATLQKSLLEMKGLFTAGTTSVSQLIEAGRAQLPEGIELEYLEVRSQDELASFADDTIGMPAVALIAAKIGSTRLIDNVELEPHD